MQASTGRSLLSLRAPAVWLVSLLSSSVAAASMVLNDYFDFRSGADTVNAPQKVRDWTRRLSRIASAVSHLHLPIM